MNIQMQKLKETYLCHLGHLSDIQTTHMEMLGIDIDEEESKLNL